MGWLVKSIFAFATLFFCGDFSSTHVGLCMYGGGSGEEVGADMFATAQGEKQQNGK